MDKSDPLRQLWLAAVLLTRLPLPRLPETAFSSGARAVWAYPLVGVGVGAIGAVTAQIALWFGFPLLAAAALALGAMMLLTGAMHEDGLADVFDGFWGGFTTARRLEIMRDSQIGTYGVLALIVAFTLRLTAVAAVLPFAPHSLIAAAAVSRGAMPLLMYALPHARAGGLSQSVGRPRFRAVAFGSVVAAAIALLLLGLIGVGAVLGAGAVAAFLALLAKRKIGGQTGDVLGATQQLSETAVLLTCAALLEP